MERPSNAITLGQTQRQQITLAPHLLQFVELIQLNQVELAQYIKQAAEDNPAIELEFENELPQQEEALDDNILDFWAEDNPPVSYRNHPDDWQEPVYKLKPSWQEETLSILRLKLTPKQLDAAEFILYNLDASGFFTMAIEDVAKKTGVPEKDVRKALADIKRSAPMPGIAAQNTKECLLLQIEKKWGKQSPLYRLIDGHLVDLLKKRYRNIKRSMGISKDEIIALSQELRSLYTHPVLEEDSLVQVLPEYRIYLVDGVPVVEEAADFIPTIKINRQFVALARQTKQKEAKAFAREKITKAKELLRAIYQRKERMKALLTFVANRQASFIEQGASGLTPLTLKEAAEHTGMHESTVSRLANKKHIQLPWGIVLLKAFFSNPLSHKTGSSKTFALELIQKILEESNGKHITDQFICDKLKKEGLHISRRTVNKYRNLLNNQR